MNTINGNFSVIQGGKNNETTHNHAAIGGGLTNIADSIYTTVCEGYSNKASGQAATVCGGYDNYAMSNAAVCGGSHNSASAIYSFVGGGYHDTVSAEYSSIVGGRENSVSGDYSVIPGGRVDSVSGDYSLAFGRKVNVSSNYVVAFFTDSSGYYTGKVGINNPDPHSTLHNNGSFALPIAECDTGDYHIGIIDYTIVITDDDYNVYLPQPDDLEGRIYVIKNKHDSGGNIQLYCNYANEYIDGIAGATGIPIAQGECRMVQSNGSDIWYILPIR